MQNFTFSPERAPFVECSFLSQATTIISLDLLNNQKISKMVEESKSQLNKEELDDKTRYIAFHKFDSLSKINQ